MACLKWFILLVFLSFTQAKKEKCVNNKTECKKGNVLPIWMPQEPLGTGDIVARAAVYFLALFYIFLGVSIIADRFMAAIEVITSKEKSVVITSITGEQRTILVRVWNETVSNLTLMALGSSAPEILLSIIEIFGNKFEAGDLGPGTIVGSAAFNLFVIVGICIQVIPTPEIRRIRHIYVFWVTVIWSVFAYIWLYAILAVITIGRVDWWEALLTFMFFPLTVLTAYLADRKMFGLGKRYLSMPSTSFSRPTTSLSGRRAQEIEMAKGPLQVQDSETMEFEEHRSMYIDVFKRLRNEHPDAPIKMVEELAEQEILKRGPKSRAYYRIQATRKLVGAGNIAKKQKMESRRHSRAEEINGVVGHSEDYGIVKVFFEPGHYTCMEDIGTVYLTVVCDRNGVNSPCVVEVDYKSEDGTATEKDDYLRTEGTLVFYPNEFRKNIGIGIVDNDIYEQDEHFFVHLSNLSVSATSVDREPDVVFKGTGLSNIQAKLGTPSTATVLIVDNDHAGCFSLENAKYEVAESMGNIDLKVVRNRGARGQVSIPYKTVDGSAKAHHDYRPTAGSLVFRDEQTECVISVEIFNDDQYEKSEDFFLQLDDPVWSGPETGEISEEEKQIADAGRPILGEVARAKVVIKESKEFKSFVDKMIASANTSLVVGTSTWKQQFKEALTIESGAEDDDDDDPGCMTYVMHSLTLPWKLLFALVPPTDYMGGWLCFIVCILVIGVMTTLIGDLASHFGCTVGLKDSITAISLVALGTSVPDTFASKVAAVNDEYADASIGNVTGSNAVNVFLGIGIAWSIAAFYHLAKGSEFKVDAGSLGFSVVLFCIGAVICIIILQVRRHSSIKGELGGKAGSKLISFIFFFSVWLAYLVLSTLEAYCVIKIF